MRMWKSERGIVKKNVGEGLPDARWNVMNDGFWDQREPLQNLQVVGFTREKEGQNFGNVDAGADQDEEFYARGDEAAPMAAVVATEM